MKSGGYDGMGFSTHFRVLDAIPKIPFLNAVLG
jgi:hypothetical protein